MNATNHNWSNIRPIRVLVFLAAAVISAGAASAQQPAPPSDAFGRAERLRQSVIQLMSAGNAQPVFEDDAGGAVCIELADRSVMFTPGTAVEDVLTLIDDQPGGASAFVAQGSRWSFTATDGVVAEGAPLTITYSFVPDGTSIPGGYDFPEAAPSVLFATLDAQFPGGRTAWKQQFADAFAEWGAHTNITYVEVADDGAVYPNALGALGQRGDVRIAMRAIGQPLAYNYYPVNGGDMVLDTQDIATFVNTSNDFRSLRNVLMHEHGHGLGLSHVIPQNGTKLMEPFLNTGFDGPQEDDLRAAQHIYGDVHELNDDLATATFIGGPLRDEASSGRDEFVVEDIALEREGSADFYAFTAFAAASIAIRVEPVGTTYEFGPQGGSATTVNAKAARNLGLRLWRRVSAANNQFALLAQIDFNDGGEDEYHPPIRYTAAGFMVAEVYSTDGVNDVQRYRLTIANGAIESSFEAPNLRVFDGAAELGDSGTVDYSTTPVGQSSSRTIIIANDGAGVLELGVPTIAGPAAGDYGLTLLANHVEPGDSVPMLLSFSPGAAGQRVAVVSVPNNDPDRGDFSFIVSGTASAPVMTVTINGSEVAHNGIVQFGDLELGDSAGVGMSIRNAGSAQLVVSNVALTGAASADYALAISNATLSPGASASTTLHSTPGQAGLREAELRIVSNANPSPFVIRLSTNGVEPIVNDCDGNGIEDADDIAAGTSEDCDANGIPDECETDTDGDGRIDACDPVPNADETLDTDGDGTPDISDECPLDANKTAEGACGCGVADLDSDADGIADCDDAFPTDPFNGAAPNEPNVPGESDVPAEPNVPVADQTGDDVGGNNGDDQQGDEVEDDQDAEVVPDLNDLTPIVPAPCGFGAGLASMLSLASLLGGGRCRRGRRYVERC